MTTKNTMKAIGVTSRFLETLIAETKDNQMPMQQLVLLVQLYVHLELNQQDLYKYTGVEKSANSRNIAKLGAGERPLLSPGPGWVESVEDPNNRRTKIVRLTLKGRRMLDRVAESAAAFL